MGLIEHPDNFSALPRAEIQREAQTRATWRYHHGTQWLKLSPNFYEAYVRRVDTMFKMVDAALAASGYLHRLHEITLADLACSEGFVAMRYLQHGLKNADCFELSVDQIERFQMMRAFNNVQGSHVHRLDLDTPGWNFKISKTYDVVLCLGILYHTENPMFFLRSVLECVAPGGVCVVESDTPQDLGVAPAFSMRPSTVAVAPGETRRLWEMRPNRAAVIQMLRHVGFEGVAVVPPPRDAACKYLGAGSKSVFLARRPA